MTARRIRIGNTRSVRLAKPLLEEAGPSDDVEIRAEHGAVIITSVVAPPAGWAEAAARCEPQGLLDAPSATRFDDEAWEW